MLIISSVGSQLLLQDVHHGNGTQEIFEGDKTVGHLLSFYAVAFFFF
jgi:acetoin utilization deacetylase AcuC-like enzyme